MTMTTIAAKGARNITAQSAWCECDHQDRRHAHPEFVGNKPMNDLLPGGTW
jgi:hypothetical protein